MIKRTAERVGTDNMIVVLGTPTPESSKLFAMTVTEGDPTWAGPLAGAGLGVPAFHVTEPDIRDQVDADVYDEQVGIAEFALESPDQILETVKSIREQNGVSV